MRLLFKLALVLTALGAVSRLLSRLLTEGDDASDVFSIAAIVGGAERTSRATALRHGRVLACCGGVQLDLREAALDPAGARLSIRALMGGVQVTMPRGWRVLLDAETRAGAIERNTTPLDALPEDAPVLHVEVDAVMGGVALSSEGDGA